MTLLSGPVLLLAACGQSGPSNEARSEQKPAPAALAATKACDVLTQEAAAKALGHEVTRMANDGGPAGLDICQYGYQGERLMDAGNVSVTIHRVDLASMKQAVLAQDYSVEPVEGLGDEAFWSKEAGLYVGKSNRTAIYLLGIGGQSDTKDRSIELAKATIGSL